MREQENNLQLPRVIRLRSKHFQGSMIKTKTVNIPINKGTEDMKSVRTGNKINW